MFVVKNGHFRQAAILIDGFKDKKPTTVNCAIIDFSDLGKGSEVQLPIHLERDKKSYTLSNYSKKNEIAYYKLDKKGK